MSNTEMAQYWYETIDPEMVSEDIEWKLADGFPADGTYHGREEVFNKWWPKLASQFSQWAATPQDFIEGQDSSVTVTGYYSGVAKETGKSFKAPFVHIWWFKGGKIVKMKHSANTLTLNKALTKDSPRIFTFFH